MFVPTLTSSTFGKYIGVFLGENNKQQLWIPKGFAHGFLSLTNKTVVQYKVTNYWDKNLERTIKWDDNLINIAWPLNKIKGIGLKISEKDSEADSLDYKKRIDEVL